MIENQTAVHRLQKMEFAFEDVLNAIRKFSVFERQRVFVFDDALTSGDEARVGDHPEFLHFRSEEHWSRAGREGKTG